MCVWHTFYSLRTYTSVTAHTHRCTHTPHTHYNTLNVHKVESFVNGVALKNAGWLENVQSTREGKDIRVLRLCCLF